MTQPASCPACGGLLEPQSDRQVCERCMFLAGLRSGEQEIHQELLQIPSSSERVTYAQQVCGNDAELQSRLLSWLEQMRDSPEVVQEVSPTGKEEAVAISGRYQLLQKIGEGGFGSVYLAQQKIPVQRQVALKILKLGMDSRQVVARFELERQTLALMDHPNIAKVFDAGVTENGRPYFVMELVRGLPITRYCDQVGLSIRQRLELFVNVCHAVQHAHQKGIIHRDLKPSNILVSVNDDEPTPKVIDFGIAKATQQELSDGTVLTLDYHILGTPAYLSPEQAALANADIDTRSDIYSLGVLLYELLTGSTPFDTKELTQAGVEEMRRMIRELEPPRPSARLSQTENNPLLRQSGQLNLRKLKLDRDLDWIVLKCLRKDRALRYATANGLAMDIQRYLSHEPIVARPPSFSYRLSKLVRRNPVVTSLAVLLVLALVSAVVTASFMSVRIARAKKEADLANARLARNVRYLESQKMEELATQGRRGGPLAWLANHIRQDPMDRVAASRALSMLSLHNFALPAFDPLVQGGPVNSAVYSPDGKTILTASDDHSARFWDSSTGQPLGAITDEDAIVDARYAAGGTRLLLFTRKGTTRIYDASSRHVLAEIPGVGAWAVTDTPAGPLLYVAHQDHALVRWDIRSARRIGEDLTVSSNIGHLEASQSGDRLAVGCDDHSVRLLKAGADQWLGPPHQFDSSVDYLKFTPDGHRLFVSLDKGQRLAICKFQTTEEVSEFTPPPPILMQSLQFTPDGRRLITGSAAAPPRIWDAETLQLLKEPKCADVQGWTDYRVSSDGSLLVGVAQNGLVQLWEVETGQPVLEPFQHQGWVRDAEFGSVSSQVLTASQDGTARLWDIRMRVSPPVSFPHSAGGGSASFNRTASRVLMSLDRDTVQVCDAFTGKPIGPALRHPGGRERAHIRAAFYSPDDSKILTAGEEGIIRVWNAASYELELELPIQRPVVLARFSPDSHFLVVGDRVGHASIWSADTGVKLGETTEYARSVIGLDFNPRGGTFVTACVDGIARCWALPSGQPVTPPMQHRGIVWSALYSPNGERIVTASADDTAQIWNAHTGEPLLKPMRHERDVFSAHFSPDGKWVLTTSEDGTARVWNALTAEPLSRVLRHAAKTWVGTFSPDSRWVATGSDDQTVRIWDPETGLPISEALPQTGAVGRVQFSPDGHRLLTFGGHVAVWNVPVAPTPVPSWFADLVEAVGGSRLSEDGQLQPASASLLRQLRQRFTQRVDNDFYTRWAKWFLVDRTQGPVPNCPVE